MVVTAPRTVPVEVVASVIQAGAPGFRSGSLPASHWLKGAHSAPFNGWRKKRGTWFSPIEIPTRSPREAGHDGGHIPAHPDDWKEGSMSLSVEEMNQQQPVANALPGESVPYYMA
jgi:hypothetical protein